MSSIAETIVSLPPKRQAAEDLLATACFAVASAIGLVGAFVGLATHGLWYDELFTAELLAPDGTSLLSRIATDVHPPLYLLILSGWSAVAGQSDVALRVLSALCASGAILVFVGATGRNFSLAGRLFGAVLATGSLFWFFQSQNARSYALALLLGAGILALSLRLLEARPQRDTRLTLGGLFTLMVAGSFVHFYVMFECLAVLMVLAVLRRALRPALVPMAIVLLASSALYVKLVIEPYSQVSLGSNWYPNNPDWYVRVVLSSVRQTLGVGGGIAVAICVAAVMLGRRQSSASNALVLGPVSLLLVGVPVVAVMGGVASSIVFAPNFYDRNVLVLSPFFWAAAALLHDRAVGVTQGRLRIALRATLVVVVLSMATIVIHRLPSGQALDLDYEPFRESAEWIGSQPACRGVELPVVSTDLPRWYKPGYAERIYTSAYGRYLQGFADPRVVFFQDIRQHSLPEDIVSELRRRLDGEGCPVLAWAAHNMPPGAMAVVRKELLAATDRANAAGRVMMRTFQDDNPGFVLYVDR